MENEKECPVCFDALKFPKLLPCSHTFCQCCLEDFLRGFADKSNLICPLCRESCYVPEKGFMDFPTNYFVAVEKNSILCKTCKSQNVSKVCYQCVEILCQRCYIFHCHRDKNLIKEDVQEESDEETIPELPWHLKWPLIHQNIRTDVVCKQRAVIVGEYPQSENAEDTRKRVRFLFPSKTGGVYVKLGGVETLFKYNEDGKILKKIYFFGPRITATSGIETPDLSLLISQYETKEVLSYTQVRGSLDFRTKTFAKTRNIFPLSMTELLNGNIAVCGPSHLCGISCNTDSCELQKMSHGALNIYSQKGDLIAEIDTDASEYTFHIPFMVAANTKTETIAVCEHTLNKVIIVDYKGRVRGFYKGFQTLSFPFLAVQERNMFSPFAVCSTLGGNFIVSDSDREYFHVINPYGKFIGVLRVGSGNLREITTMCVDLKKNIWTGHFFLGTIGVVKPEFYNNDLSKIET